MADGAKRFIPENGNLEERKARRPRRLRRRGRLGRPKRLGPLRASVFPFYSSFLLLSFFFVLSLSIFIRQAGKGAGGGREVWGGWAPSYFPSYSSPYLLLFFPFNFPFFIFIRKGSKDSWGGWGGWGDWDSWGGSDGSDG